MKIIIYDTKCKTHRFLKGVIGSCSCTWITDKENAGEYTKEDFEKVLNDFKNNKINSNYTSLGYIK